MQPHFPRANLALHYTLEWYSGTNIEDWINRLSGAERSYFDPQSTFRFHDALEDEIYQVIQTTNRNTQVYFFELLRGWLEEPRIKEVNKPLILEAINKHNDRQLEFYQTCVDNKAYFESQGILSPYSTEEEIAKGPKYIKTEFIPQYFDFVDKIITNFRNTISHPLRLFDQGKISPGTSVIIEKGYIESSLIPNQEPNNKQLPSPSKKLKVNLSVPQLAFLFRLLHDLKPELLDIKSKTELYRFIIDNFSTKGTDSITEGSFKNNFNNPEKDTATFWISYLNEMIKRSRNW